MSPARRIGIARRALDKLLDFAGRPLAWGAFAILQLRDRVRPGHWHFTSAKKEDDRDE